MSSKRKLFKYKTLDGLVTRLRDDLKTNDFILLYAFNGTGKTRTSMAFKEKGKKTITTVLKDSEGNKLIDKNGKPQTEENIVGDTLYFNAFTEDLFIWDNDLENDTERILQIKSESKFFNGFRELALEEKIFAYLERYSTFDFKIDYDTWKISFNKRVRNKKYNPKNPNNTEPEFAIKDNIKISRGEENIFIWCIFLAICELTIDETEAYNWVKYLYIDDPISSLDDNNAIAVASDLAKLLKKSKDRLKTVLSSHHGLFFNVMCNELKIMSHKKYFLHRDKESDTYTLRATDDTPFFHHVAMLSELQKAIDSDQIYTHHFNMLRSILEKTAIFFGFNSFSACIHGVDDEVLYARALNLLSHGKHSAYERREMGDDNKKLFRDIFSAFLTRYQFDLPEILPNQPTQTS